MNPPVRFIRRLAKSPVRFGRRLAKSPVRFGRRLAKWIPGLATLLLLACAPVRPAGESSTGNDAGTADAGGHLDGGDDAGAPDSGGIDAGEPDAGESDAGPGNDNGDAGYCTPETTAQTCARIDVQCGMVDATDNCGAYLRFDCGTCMYGTCSSTHQCVCTALTLATYCATLVNGATACGAVAVPDGCGGMVTGMCPACVSTAECVPGHNGEQDACCTPTKDPLATCSADSACGMQNISDGCENQTVDCGACGTGETCTNGQCREAGNMGHATTCTLGMAACGTTTCGTVTVADSCNVMRTIDCSTCAAGTFCNATAGMCCDPAGDMCQ